VLRAAAARARAARLRRPWRSPCARSRSRATARSTCPAARPRAARRQTAPSAASARRRSPPGSGCPRTACSRPAGRRRGACADRGRRGRRRQTRRQSPGRPRRRRHRQSRRRRRRAGQRRSRWGGPRARRLARRLARRPAPPGSSCTRRPGALRRTGLIRLARRAGACPPISAPPGGSWRDRPCTGHVRPSALGHRASQRGMPSRGGARRLAQGMVRQAAIGVGGTAVCPASRRPRAPQPPRLQHAAPMHDPHGQRPHGAHKTVADTPAAKANHAKLCAAARGRGARRRTGRRGVAGHARHVALVQVVHLLLHLRGQLVDVVRAVGALKLPVPVLAAQVAVLVVLQRACAPRAPRAGRGRGAVAWQARWRALPAAQIKHTRRPGLAAVTWTRARGAGGQALPTASNEPLAAQQADAAYARGRPRTHH